MNTAELLTTPLTRMQRVYIARAQWGKIAELCIQCVPQAKIASMYRISVPTVCRILQLHNVKVPNWRHVRHDAPDITGNKFQRCAIARTHIDEIISLYMRGVTISKIAARYHVSDNCIYKMIRESKTPNRGKIKHVIIPDAGGNQRQKTEYARRKIKQIVKAFKSGTSILSLARQCDVGYTTISKMLATAGASRDYKKPEFLANKDIAARIDACRLPDIEYWQCRSCGRNFDGKVQPYQCTCGSGTFDFIRARRRLDLSKLDALDGLVPAAQSSAVHKTIASQGFCS